MTNQTNQTIEKTPQRHGPDAPPHEAKIASPTPTSQGRSLGTPGSRGPRIAGDPTSHQRPLILRKKQVLRMLGLSASTVYTLQKAGKFPQPIKLGVRAAGWLSSDIDQWVAEKAAERAA